MQTQMTVQTGAELMGVRFVSGEAYQLAVRGHRVMVDQPVDAGGEDNAPTPAELFAPTFRTTLQAVAAHCTVHNSLTTPPDVTIDVI